MKQNRRKHSPSFKARVALNVLRACPALDAGVTKRSTFYTRFVEAERGRQPK